MVEEVNVGLGNGQQSLLGVISPWKMSIIAIFLSTFGPSSTKILV
jgi:hypothetical protein